MDQFLSTLNPATASALLAGVALLTVLIGNIVTVVIAGANKNKMVHHTQQREFTKRVERVLDQLIELRAELQSRQVDWIDPDPTDEARIFDKHAVVQQNEQGQARERAYGRASALLRSIPDKELRKQSEVIMKKQIAVKGNPKLEAIDKGIERLGEILWEAHRTGKKPEATK